MVLFWNVLASYKIKSLATQPLTVTKEMYFQDAWKWGSMIRPTNSNFPSPRAKLYFGFLRASSDEGTRKYWKSLFLPKVRIGNPLAWGCLIYDMMNWTARTRIFSTDILNANVAIKRLHAWIHIFTKEFATKLRTLSHLSCYTNYQDSLMMFLFIYF